MADQRADGKKLIGAQASAELRAGVDTWLNQHPGATQTDFVLAACLEKLKNEGIEVDHVMALRDRRGRVPASAEPEVNADQGKAKPVKYPSLKKKTNFESATSGHLKKIAGKGSKVFSTPKASGKSATGKHPAQVANETP